MNGAYQPEYLQYRGRKESLFDACTSPPDFMSSRPINEQYQKKKVFYSGQDGEYPFHGTENFILDRAGNAVYSWRNINDEAEFETVIRHSNGKEYLLFRRDLYGYSVLELNALRDFHYIPLESICYGEKKDFSESFIWTEVHYNPKNDLLAVGGCFRAAPYSTILLDFRDPMKANELWIDFHQLLDPGYDTYCDINFAGWNAATLLLDGENEITGELERLEYSGDDCRRLLTQGR